MFGKIFVRTFDDGTKYRETAFYKIQDYDPENCTNIKFIVKLGDDKFDRFILYGSLYECVWYKKFILHIVFAVKHDLCHKEGLSSDGQLNYFNTTESKYYSVVSLCSLQIEIVAVELNDREIIIGDISSAYLEAHTQEKIWSP